MNNSVADFQETMQHLADTFIKGLPGKIEDLETLWQQLQNEWHADKLQIVHRKAHELAGTSKTFGLSELSGLADSLEQTLKAALQNEAQLDEQQRAEIFALLREVGRLVVNQASDFPRTFAKQFNDYLVDMDEVSHVFVVDDDQEAAQELALQVSYYGYEVEVFGRLEDFREAIKRTPGAIVLMNVEFSDDAMAGIRTMKEIQQEMEEPVLVVFLSSNDDFAARLEAVRAGGIAYLTKPINSSELIEQLDSFSVPQTQEPFRVLIVDDCATDLAFHAAVLEQSGMIVRTVEKMNTVMRTLLEFNPDVILIDVYLPECSGIELAKVIRQLDGLFNVTVVYLSSENDFNTQQEAMLLAGDDFLAKPIDPKRLVSAVTRRVQRARQLRGLMVRDGLTGLFNYTAIREQLGREIVRSNRLKTPLSLAMVDVDFFKKVNDNYGNAAGDRVLKSLARLLKQRLRGTDIVGRYGGEEFAVIMTDTNAPEAAKVIDEIRKVFSRLLHMSDNKEFKVTFSCGIADIKHFPDVKSVSEAADKALYQAKKKGRNQVVITSGD
ncbi:response regulator receiver modulated diguanylate cyclase [Nitrosomonas marina]|uniref:diguanylate cyclase n=1 Tax=Nitrosomonas marina TaxID=917 RepID=A0A1I0A4D9_9PROT|nr:diguanylate cyclase [Nitrosomonas marina]SES88941.1 response regulator receiver modulated diguanylate cyclase [Nitrosomonas marina]